MSSSESSSNTSCCTTRRRGTNRLIESKRNPFCHFIHDAVTLQNKKKYESMGLQFTDKKYRCNHVIAIAFRRVLTTVTSSVVDLAKNISQEITGEDFEDIFRMSG